MSELGTIIDELYEVVKERKAEPKDGSYTNYLIAKGVDKICKKIGEESTEVVIAVKNASREEIIYETADLLYHLIVMMGEMDVTPTQIYQELKNRRS